VANASSWQQFGLAFCGDRDVGGVYLPIFGGAGASTTPDVRTGKLSRSLQQYFRHVRLGAVRVGAASDDSALRPVAFRNPSGKYAVVVQATAGGAFTVSGLPSGRYGVSYTTSEAYASQGADTAVGAAGMLAATIPGAGVITIYGK
jgi:hypothetical protein